MEAKVELDTAAPTSGCPVPPTQGVGAILLTLCFKPGGTGVLGSRLSICGQVMSKPGLLLDTATCQPVHPHHPHPCTWPSVWPFVQGSSRQWLHKPVEDQGEPRPGSTLLGRP